MSIRMKYRVWVSGYVYAFTRRAAVLQFVLLLFSPVFELLLFFPVSVFSCIPIP